MVQPLEYYQKEKTRYEVQLEQLRRKSWRLSLIRTGLFICTGLLAYFAVDHTLWLVILLFLAERGLRLVQYYAKSSRGYPNGILK